MTDPQIRYTRTSDGVNIAYWAMGDGETILDMGQPPATHVEMEWRLAPMRAWYERFARRGRFARFDSRGLGLSDRDIDTYSLETLVSDTEAVVDALALDRVTLLGQINSAAAAILYAAKHPGRVSKLILWCGYSRGSEFFNDSGTQALRDMIDRNWHMMTETASRSRFEWREDEHASEYAELWRAGVSPRVMAMLMDNLKAVDVTPALAQVKAPTLVLQREKRGPEVARHIASSIPDAQVTMFEGGSAAPYLGDADVVWSRIAAFMGWQEDSPSRSGGTRTILFTDIVGHTEMMQRLGDVKGRHVLREHERITRETLGAHGGAEVKTMGDGFMASFGSVTSAVECAIELQRAFAAHTESMPEPLHVRVGLNAGEPIEEDGDLFGATVILASRIAAKAGAGEILIPEPVRHLLSGKAFTFSDRGEHAMKGFDDAVRLYEVRWQS